MKNPFVHRRIAKTSSKSSCTESSDLLSSLDLDGNFNGISAAGDRSINVSMLDRFMGLRQRLGVLSCFSQLASHLDLRVLPRHCVGELRTAESTSCPSELLSLEWPESSLSPHGKEELEESDRELFALSIWMSMSEADTECSSSRQDMKHWRLLLLLRVIVYLNKFAIVMKAVVRKLLRRLLADESGNSSPRGRGDWTWLWAPRLKRAQKNMWLRKNVLLKKRSFDHDFGYELAKTENKWFENEKSLHLTTEACVVWKTSRHWMLQGCLACGPNHFFWLVYWKAESACGTANNLRSTGSPKREVSVAHQANALIKNSTSTSNVLI